MADFRQIHVLIWDDDWFCQLSSDEKVVFIWLFSNRRASVSGLYQFTEFICSRETGIPIENVRKAIKHLVDDKKIYVEGEWVWVKNLRKYNYYPNGNADVRIRKDLEQLPDNGLRHAYIDYYKPLDSPLQAPIPPLQEQEQEKEHEKDIELKKEKITSSNFSLLVREYEQNIGVITSKTHDLISEDFEKYGYELCSKAITEAVRKNKRNWAYVEGVLKNWWNDGYKNSDAKNKKQIEYKEVWKDGKLTFEEVSA